MIYNLTNLSPLEVQTIWTGLLELPAKQSFPVLEHLKKQIQEQESPPPASGENVDGNPETQGDPSAAHR